MSKELTIEQRLAALEQAVADLKKQQQGQSDTGNWLENIIGSFKDEPAFEEVLEYGRALRASDLPPEDGTP